MPVESRTAGTQTERSGDLLTEYDKVALGAEAIGALVIARAADLLSSRAGRVLVYRLGGLVRHVLGSARKEAWY